MNFVYEFKMWAGTEGRGGFIAEISTRTDDSSPLRDHEGLKNIPCCPTFLIRCGPVLEI